MMWSKDTLLAVAADRGETSVDVEICKLLLSHERARGRTEEEYPRDKALSELDAALDRRSPSLPLPSAQAYLGLKQLRDYAAERAKGSEISRGAGPVAVEPKQAAPSVSMAAAERERG